jgi:hypothetical protein
VGELPSVQKSTVSHLTLVRPFLYPVNSTLTEIF